jgi:hypothetical protein
MSAKEGVQLMSTPVGIKKPRAMATAFIAWLTAPAPTACSMHGAPSLTIPAIAPATEAGEDLLETLRKSICCSWYDKIAMVMCC